MDGISNYAMARKVKYQEKNRLGAPASFLTERGLAAVVGLQALPGTTQNTLPLNTILEKAVEEAKMLYSAGIRNIMIQNVSDVPMYTSPGKHITSYMTAIGYAVRVSLPQDCILGVSVLRDDAEAMVSIASAIEADYIRPKCYVGAVVGTDGIHEGIINQVLEMRYKLRCDVQIWADIHDRSTVPLGAAELVDSCQQAVSQGLADALNIAGKSFEESLRKIDMVKKAMPKVYVNLGGGANASNLQTVYKHANGIFVASCLKTTGNMTGPLDESRLHAFMQAYNKQ